MTHVHDLLTIFQIQAVDFFQTMSACLVSLIRLSGQIAKCKPIIDGNEKQCSQVKIFLFVLVPNTYTFLLPQQQKFINQRSQVHVNIIVRPEAAGLLIGIEYSRVMDSSWMYLTSFVTTRIGVELVAAQRKLPDCVVVGFQLYSARTFHVTVSPRIYKGGPGPPRNTSIAKAIQTTTQDVGYYATRGPNLFKSQSSLHHRVPEQSIPIYKPYC